MTETETTPVACTLTASGLAERAERWRQLMAQEMTGRAETTDGLRLSFRTGAEDEVRVLAAAETECCPWATWAVEQDAGTIVLNVRSTAGGVATLHALFAPASGG
jgi:MerR family transcriptional regulator, copper efflux regulator